MLESTESSHLNVILIKRLINVKLSVNFNTVSAVQQNVIFLQLHTIERSLTVPSSICSELTLVSLKNDLSTIG